MDLPPIAPSMSGYSASVQASNYYNEAGGCVGHNSVVLMGDGTWMPIYELQKGDIVHTPYGPTTVRCLVATPRFKGQMVKIDDLLITPWHPIRVNESWKFPYNLFEKHGSYVEYDDDVYNLVLDEHHIAIIDGFECCTLGHGMKGEVIGHEYFGTRKVLIDLFALPGWSDGVVILHPQSYARNPVSGLVEGMTIGEQ